MAEVEHRTMLPWRRVATQGRLYTPEEWTGSKTHPFTPPPLSGVAYLAALPVAVLLAGAFPILATAREPDPTRLEAPDDGAPALKAAPPPLRFVQASGEPPKTPRTFAIAAQDLNTAMLEFADRTGLQVFYDAERLKGSRTEGVRGTYTVEQALGQLLAGTQFTYRFTSATSVTLEPAPAEPAADSSPSRFQIDPTIVEASQEDEEQDRGFKAQMQTTATKTPLSIRETPQSVSVITQDSLKARQVQDLGQALETAAGVFQFSGTGPFAGKAAFGFDGVTVRGMELDGAFNLLEDGFISPASFYKPDLALYERVEVIKGPSSTGWRDGWA